MARGLSEVYRGEVVQTTAFVLQNQSLKGYKPVFFRLLDGSEHEKRAALEKRKNRFDTTAQDEFRKISGSPVAYWISNSITQLFSEQPTLGAMGEPRRGLQPGNTPKNVRLWHEGSVARTAFTIEPSEIESVTANSKWVGFTSGGSYRKWAGNIRYVVNWYKSGHDIKNGHNPIVPNEHLYFLEAISWSKVNSGIPSFRRHPGGMIPGDASPFAIIDETNFSTVFASLNSVVTPALLQVLAPTMNFQIGDAAPRSSTPNANASNSSSPFTKN